MPYVDKEKQRTYQQQWNKKYYQANKNKEKERTAKRKNDIAAWFVQLKSNLCCERCGEREPACLDFHHRNPREKEFNLGLAKNWGWSKKRIEKELQKCMVVCSNCHRKLHTIATS